MIYLIGINSFIGRSFYLMLKERKNTVYCLSHDEINQLVKVNNDDIIINFCGVNRADKEEEYINGNYIFIKSILEIFKNNNTMPHLIQISSLMIYGFVDKQLSDLPKYQQYFINSKLMAELYLTNNYPENKLTIVRPSNIYGYDCEPYYNNLLVTLMYEKIIGNYKINQINKKCIRNFLSVDGLCNILLEFVNTKKCGSYNVISNNNISLEYLVNLIYQNDIPNEITFIDGETNIPNINNVNQTNNIIVEEDLVEQLLLLEEKMAIYQKKLQPIVIKKLSRLHQPRGDMIEISDIKSKRLYMITLSDHSIRGDHYHYEQTEHFFINNGKVIFLLAHKDNSDIRLFKILCKDNLIIVGPNIIHTLINDFINNEPEIVIASTQEYIAGHIPDTEYINIIPFNN